MFGIGPTELILILIFVGIPITGIFLFGYYVGKSRAYKDKGGKG